MADFILVRNLLLDHFTKMEGIVSWRKPKGQVTMSSYCKVIIMGLLGGEPTSNTDSNGTPVCNFSVAHNETYKDRDGNEQTKVTWIRVSTWGPQATNCQTYLHTGSRVLVEGTLLPDSNGNPRIWQGNDGQARANFEVRAQVVRFAGQGGNGSSTPEPAEEEEIPF